MTICLVTQKEYCYYKNYQYCETIYLMKMNLVLNKDLDIARIIVLSKIVIARFNCTWKTSLEDPLFQRGLVHFSCAFVFVSHSHIGTKDFEWVKIKRKKRRTFFSAMYSEVIYLSLKRLSEVQEAIRFDNDCSVLLLQANYLHVK